jgi:hypothetical protein
VVIFIGKCFDRIQQYFKLPKYNHDPHLHNVNENVHSKTILMYCEKCYIQSIPDKNFEKSLLERYGFYVTKIPLVYNCFRCCCI